MNHIYFDQKNSDWTYSRTRLLFLFPRYYNSDRRYGIYYIVCQINNIYESTLSLYSPDSILYSIIKLWRYVTEGYIILIIGGALLISGIVISALWAGSFAGPFLRENTSVSLRPTGKNINNDCDRHYKCSMG